MVRSGLVLTLAHRRPRLALLAVLVGLLVAAALPAAARAVGPAFDPATPSVFISHGTPTTQLSEGVQANGTIALHDVGPDSGLQYNAIAYDTDNNYVYAINNDTNPGEIMQIGSDGVPSDTGVNLGIPGGGGTVIAGWNPTNHRIYYEVPGAVAGTEALRIYDPATNTLGATLALSQNFAGSDITYSQGFFWGWATTPGGAGGDATATSIGRIDPTTGTVTNFPATATLFPGCTPDCGAGAAYTYGNGNLGFDENSDGKIFVISVTNPASANPTFRPVFQAQGFASGAVDATASPGLPTDLVMHKTATSQVPDGGTVTYTLTVTNNGPGNSSGYTVSDTLPAALSNPATSTPGCSIAGHVVTCVGNPLSAGQTSAPITVTGTVPNPFTTPITNTATVESNEQDPTPGNNSDGVTTTPQADLSVVKTATPTPAVPGTDETYTLLVKNNGPDTATNTSVADPLPSGLSFISASTGCTNANGTVTCAIGSLAPGASRTFTVKAHLASSVDSCADIRNTATVTSSIADPVPGNNSSTFCPQFKGKSDLSLTKTPSRTSVPVGGQIMYTLVVKNSGPSDDTGVLVTDPMAAGLTLVAATPSQGSCSTAGGKVSCDIGTLKDGGSAQVLVTATVTAAAGTNVANTASVTGDHEDPNPSNNDGGTSITVTPGPEPHFDLVMDKTANHKSITAGQSVTYKLVVTNKGPDAAPNAKVTDTISTSMTVSSVKTTQGSCTKGSPITCSLGTIAAGGKVTITVVAKPKTTGSRQRNAASATGDGTDNDPSNNLDKVDLAVKVKLRITKVADRTTVSAGGRIHYTIRVTDPSRYSVDDVRVCDTLPSGLAYVSSKPRATLSKGRQCWKISHLAAHRSKVFKLTVRALRGANGNKTNRVSATGGGVSTARASRTVHVLGTQTGAPPVTG